MPEAVVAAPAAAEQPDGGAAPTAPPEPSNVIDLTAAPVENAAEAIDLVSEDEGDVATPRRRRRRERAATFDHYDPAVEAAKPQWAPPAPKRRRAGPR